MDTERKVKTMSVELAIQRDREFHAKLAKLNLRSMLDSEADLLPSQMVDFVGPSSRLHSEEPWFLQKVDFPKNTWEQQLCKPQPSTPSPSQESDCLSRAFSGSKRKEPAPASDLEASPAPPSPESLGVTPNPTDDLFCGICNITCCSAFNYKQHTSGKKHKAKLQEIVGPGSDTTRKWCATCDIWCMHEGLFQQHLEGHKHKAQLRRLQCQNGDRENSYAAGVV